MKKSSVSPITEFEDAARYFQKDGQAIEVRQKMIADRFFSRSNFHVLANSKDINSAPVAEWKEITAVEYELAQELLVLQAAKIGRDLRTAEKKKRKKVYSEAVKIGFSPASASTMSGYVPK